MFALEVLSAFANCLRTSKDVLEWLKDFGNQFNKQASKASFIEHLLALDRIEPALNEHLDSFNPPMRSSHKEFEKTCKTFVDTKFPGRFGSYRELQAATAFRNRLVEYGLWSSFIEDCNQHVDFAKAGEMDAGNIYRMLNVVSRKMLAYVFCLNLYTSFELAVISRALTGWTNNHWVWGLWVAGLLFAVVTQ